MRKRFAALLVVILLISVLSGCGGQGGATATVKKDPKLIGLVLSSMNNPFFISVRNGAEEKARALGYELIILDSQNKSEKDAANVEVLIGRGVSLILLNPTDSEGATQVVEKANKAGVKVITLDRRSNGGDVISHIASDNVEGGRTAADFLNEKLGGKGNIAMLQGIDGTSAAIDRGKGFSDRIKEFPGMQIVVAKPAGFDRAQGLAVMEEILREQTDLAAVFAQNDEMALGALPAISASGKNILVVGFDGVADALTAIDEGRMAATVQQQPELMGTLGVEAADRVLKGMVVDAFIPVELKLVVGE